MVPKTIYCHGEASEFPVDKFKHNDDGEIHVPYIHKASPPHYWTGEEWKPGNRNGGEESGGVIDRIPVTLAAPEDTL
jgi:hypothetical protein